MTQGSSDGSVPVMDTLASRVASRFQTEQQADPTVLRVATRFMRALTLPRPSYLPPEARDTKPIEPEGTDLAIWVWEKEYDTPLKGKVLRLFGIAFAGKANKPLWHHSFKDESSRQRLIDETIKNRKSLLEYKQKRLQERKDFQHDFQKGDILYSSWGYDQTNVDFYEVVEVVGKMVSVREIAGKVTREERGADYVVAVPGKFVGPVLKRKVGVGGYVKIDNVQSASKWDGKPKYQTAAGWGH